MTGSTRGIGAALALGFARAGATVVLHGRQIGQVETARNRLDEELRAQGVIADLHTVAFDVTDYEAMVSAVQHLEEGMGSLDVLVNNAGMQLRGPLLEIPRSGWEQVLALTNLTSCFVLAQAVAVRMVARGAGKIINVCSVANLLVRATIAPDAVAKAGLGTLTEAMCSEWGAFGVQANAVGARLHRPHLNSALLADPNMNAWVIQRTPARRWGTVHDVVGPAVWLASSASDFVNGQTIYVDGGLTASL